MDERLKFVARLLEGEKMAPLCRAFGISRKTGYKLFNRYKEFGLEGLSDRSRRPYRHANQLPYQVEHAILGVKKEYPSWGAPKIREKLLRLFPHVCSPAVSTIHAVLDRHALVQRHKRRRYKATGTVLSCPHKPNELWCCDYKGEFMLGNKRYCYPLTITDAYSRYVLACDGHPSTKESGAFATFEAVFQEYGLPCTIRSDNGLPFASPNALYGLSKLSVWWLRLGIQIERIKPGNPQQNGRHERMHRTLKQETARPAAHTLLQQQEAFDRFCQVYNHERPHQGIAHKYPADLYTPSCRVYHGLPEVTYPFADRTITVTQCGRICWGKRKIHLTTVLAGQNVGITQTDDTIWLVSFMQYDIGYFDEDSGRVEPIEDPFMKKLLPLSQV